MYRPRYGCHGGEDVVQAPAPERPNDNGMATELLIAHAAAWRKEIQGMLACIGSWGWLGYGANPREDRRTVHAYIAIDRDAQP